MLNEYCVRLGKEPSAIRELFAYGQARKAEIGADKVFDFSIGNPSVPTPSAVREALAELVQLPSVQLHSYTAAPGMLGARKAIAQNLNERFGTNYTADNLFLTCGAAASVAISLTALLNKGDEVIVIAPFFPEYRVWIERLGAVCKPVMADLETFQLDLDAIKQALTPKTKAVIINTPNNPCGVVYTEEELRALGNLLREADQNIYLLSDEPYRELVFDGTPVPWVPACYENTLVCYSYSKSFSLAGERIGYILAPDTLVHAQDVRAALGGAARCLGFVCAPSLMQLLIERCQGVQAEIASYNDNRELLCTALQDMGYDFVQPRGAFYIWMKSLEPNAEAFSKQALKHELLLVPSDSFGLEGWVRISFCVSAEQIKNSLPAFAALKQDYENQA